MPAASPKKTGLAPKKSATLWLLAALVGLFVILVFAPRFHTSDSVTRLVINDRQLQLEVADTPAERHQGLSGRNAIGQDQGMLFVFEEPAAHGFWMKDMRFAIDIIWIDSNRQVIGVSQNVPPDSYPQVYYPPGPVRYVLEVRAGFVQRNGIKSGQQIILQK